MLPAPRTRLTTCVAASWQAMDRKLWAAISLQPGIRQRKRAGADRGADAGDCSGDGVELTAETGSIVVVPEVSGPTIAIKREGEARRLSQ